MLAQVSLFMKWGSQHLNQGLWSPELLCRTTRLYYSHRLLHSPCVLGSLPAPVHATAAMFIRMCVKKKKICNKCVIWNDLWFLLGTKFTVLLSTVVCCLHSQWKEMLIFIRNLWKLGCNLISHPSAALWIQSTLFTDLCHRRIAHKWKLLAYLCMYSRKFSFLGKRTIALMTFSRDSCLKRLRFYT